MMDTRRDFLKKAILLSGAAGISSAFPRSVQAALAIDPAPGSTYLDAEHIVILMQENRSFDHCFGTLKGVRGFNDPRAVTLPDKNRVWLQTGKDGKTTMPFRFDIKNTKITWMGSTPHGRSDQVDAWNHGKMDNWIEPKRVWNKQYREMPLTMGYYTREDIPFYYAMADAFTVCDHNFCSAITSTNPNRLFFWTGSIREDQKKRSEALIRNLSNDRWGVLKYDTFPERLEAAGISWKFYQNDIDCGGGFTGEERAWLANFGCNPLEWFANYNVKFSKRYLLGLRNQLQSLPGEIDILRKKISSIPSSDVEQSQKIQASIAAKERVLAEAKSDLQYYSQEVFEKLSSKEKSLFRRAFTINSGDEFYHQLEPLIYEDNGERRELNIPKGDVLYQFRKDVEEGNLPAVSWLAGAQYLSDHPSAPWYGSLHASEILNILTENPEVWKKTIFILTFDENDGYFDHIPPFVAPDPKNAATGKVSSGIDYVMEYIYKEEELAAGIPKRGARSGPVGLGYRVPMIVASPWSKGGKVCSQVFDHTSTLQFLETFFEQKLGKDLREQNISEWRRTLCGDLTSVFTPFHGKQAAENLPFLEPKPFIGSIFNAQFKELPTGFKFLNRQEIDKVNKTPLTSGILPGQEKGISKACAIPYELYVEGNLVDSGFEIKMQAGNKIFGKKAAGSGFNAYVPGVDIPPRSYTVRAGDVVSDVFLAKLFDKVDYHLAVNGPNGFMREFKGSETDPPVTAFGEYEMLSRSQTKLTGNLLVRIVNDDPAQDYTIRIIDNSYGNKEFVKKLKAKQQQQFVLNLKKSFQWYDFSVRIDGVERFERRFSGHVETGTESYTDPLMGGMLTRF